MSASSLPLQRIAITGSSGLYGRAVIRNLRTALPHAVVLGIDAVSPRSHPPDVFVPVDIRGSGCDAPLTAFHPDTILHLAFAVRPSRDAAAERAVNVEGSARVLATAAACGAARLLVASSATVYGAWPDAHAPHPETAPLRPRTDYSYAAHKGEVETLLAAFAAAHPAIAVSWTRPAIVCGPGVRNFLSDIFLTLPCMLLPDGADTPLQFVHEDDLARATLAILTANARGPFNVAPADALTQRQLARLMGIPALPVPFAVINAVSRAWWALRLPWVRTPPGLAHYLRHPWLVDSSRLTRELGFDFAHSSREAFQTVLAPPRPGADTPAA